MQRLIAVKKETVSLSSLCSTEPEAPADLLRRCSASTASTSGSKTSLISVNQSKTGANEYVCSFFIAIVFLLQCAFVQAQQFNSSNDLKWHVGCELFQMLLEDRGLTGMQSVESSLETPLSSVIVLTGDLWRLSPNILNGLIPFVRRGGNVLIASDQPKSMLGIGEIKAGPVKSNRAENRYLDFEDCLRIQDIDTSHESMIGVREIVLNRTAWLVLPTGFAANISLSWQVIASLPSDCLPAASSKQPLIAVGNGPTPNAGVMVMIADTSVLTNGMMWHGDNSTYAIRLAELLGRGQKTHMSFVVDGRVLSSYKDRLQPPSPTSLKLTNRQSLPVTQELPNTDFETRLRVANHVIKSVADSNILNEALANQPRPVNARRYSLAVLAMLAAAGVLLILMYVLRRVPAILPRQPIIPHLSAFEMDTSTKQRSSQYGPAAFILAREFCKECSGTISDKEWKNEGASFRHSLSIPNDKAFRDKLEYVRSFEICNLVPRVSEMEFLKLGKTIHQLREALHPPHHSNQKTDSCP